MAMDGTNVNCPTVFSERCMELLTRDERSCFDWIPVRMPARTRKKYFECVPRDFVQRVAVTDWPVHGNRCPRCKRVFMAVSPDARLDYQNNKIHSWAAASDVDAIPANCPFAFGDASMWSLVLPMDRARELTKHKHALGLTTARFGVVPPSQVLLREDEATPERLVLPDRWELRRK